jgi:3-isopropylmalate dehydratase small subunit
MGEGVEVNLHNAVLTARRDGTLSLGVNPARRLQLLEGLDDLDPSLRRWDEIKTFQVAHR